MNTESRLVVECGVGVGAPDSALRSGSRLLVASAAGVDRSPAEPRRPATEPPTSTRRHTDTYRGTRKGGTGTRRRANTQEAEEKLVTRPRQHTNECNTRAKSRPLDKRREWDGMDYLQWKGKGLLAERFYKVTQMNRHEWLVDSILHVSCLKIRRYCRLYHSRLYTGLVHPHCLWPYSSPQFPSCDMWPQTC